MNFVGRGLGLFVLLLASARSAELPKGKILEKVASTADATQTYALFIPTSFDPARKWPVVFCFDPGARGLVPVERFKAAAEKYGYIVAGSNNSRNGPWAANAAAITAMVSDVNRFLPLDSARIYVAGLSGGARVACQVAIGGLARGVIACSAAFPGNETPDPVKFPFFGTAGVTDFNYLELRRVDRDLDDRRAAHRVVFHNGGHEWLSAALADEALAWLDLQAMRTGAKPKDAAWIEAQFAARQSAVPATPLTERLRALRSLAADFKGLADVGPAEKEAAALAASRELRDAAKAERAAERREEALADNLTETMLDGTTAFVKKIAAELRAKSEAKDTPEGQMAFRVLQGAYSSCSETARELLRQEAYVDAEAPLEMMTVMRPERPQAFFDLARCYAHRGDKKRAIAALQQAAAAGFKDAPRIENEKVFAALRSEPAFLELVSAMR